MTDIPAPAWAAVGGIVVAVLQQAGSWWTARANKRPTESDRTKTDILLQQAQQENTQNWIKRALAAEAENERLYVQLRESHQREERVLRVNDSVLQTANQVREEVSRRALGAGDASYT